MLSKTKINKRMKKKTNSILIETILLAKKSSPEIASAISVSARKQAKINLSKINKAKAKVVIIPGKVLSLGEVDKKIEVYALGFSEKAKEKLKKASCKAETLIEKLKSMKKGEKLEGEILKW